MTENIYWIWLSEALGAGNRAAITLLEHFGNAESVYQANEDALAALAVSDSVKEALSDKELERAIRIEEYCVSHDIGILTYRDSGYPNRLRQIINPPVLLYYQGALPPFDARLCIAAVGTRRLTDYGANMAYRFGYELSVCGAIVVSGLAAGIDARAHTGSLDAGGQTVAVLGNGLDVIYPKENEELMKTLRRSGTILTEYCPGSRPEGYHFPMRNRIISGLCQATTVIEASRGSGSLITADYAIRQGRDVYVLPGNVGRYGFEGSNDLIKDGATLVTCAADVIRPYEMLYADTVSRIRLKEEERFRNFRGSIPLHNAAAPELRKKTIADRVLQRASELLAPEKRNKAKVLVPSAKPEQPPKSAEPKTFPDEKQQRIYDALTEPMTADALALSTGLPVREIMLTCTMLEIQKAIKALPGGLFQRVE